MKNTLHLVSLSALLMSLCVACATDPSESVPQAKVQEPAPSESSPTATPAQDKTQKAAQETAQKTTQEKTQAQPAAKRVDLTGEIIFIGSKVTGSHTNRFKSWTGHVTLGADLEQSAFSFTVETASVETDYLSPTAWSGKLKDHLLSEDFFDVKNHPKATFKSTALKRESGDQYQVSGVLTIRGQSKAITFPAKISAEGGFNASAEFSINRKEYKIMYDGKADNLIREGVVLKISLKAKS